MMCLAVNHSDKSFYTTDVENALAYAIEEGAKIVNMSLAIADTSQNLNALLDSCYVNNILVVKSAGNEFEGDYSLTYPAYRPHVLAVGAS
jgi:hypothetical protein